MTRPSVFRLLQTLTLAECNDFQVFLQMPSFNIKPNVQQLYAAWLKYLQATANNPQIANSKVSKTELWQQAFPDKAFSPTQFSKHCSELKAVAEQFLAFVRLQQQKNLQENLLFGELYARELAVFIDEKLPIMVADNALKPLFSCADYTEAWQTAHTIDKYYETTVQRTTKDKLHVTAASEWLDLHYTLHKLRYICYIYNQNTVQASEIEAPDANFLFKTLAEHPNFTATHPLLNAYYLMAQRPLTQAALAEAWAFLNVHEHQFSSEDCDSLYSFLLNYCTYSYNHRIDAVDALTFLVHQHCLENNISSIKSSLSSIYKNTIKIGCIGIVKGQLPLKSVADFARKYHNENISNDIFKYCNALIAFHATDYEEVVFLLLQTDFKDYYNRFDTLCLQLRALYMCADSERFVVHSERFRKQLERVTQFPAENVVIYERFRSLIVSLFTLKNSSKKTWKNVFAKKLAQRKQEGTVLNYDWFVQQIGGLQ